ncbi:restriction endonuclease subunit S [Thiothrix fructosivorans]|uniref:Restriction endonuclease subunit S n=1 Tax=Thiothrix fructosivorans TaxID=111770 RepID=A0A8B0SI38_9GAMM|nr:restriction endonuclease subunit S [Thiothrix fructosivorans]MBO0612699.1 restriction endonuclease subunit S [Thiothrix fructosivorans]QTX11833.1 restriction endonuclease subunit S [Thiothrix fructosivorans]
MKNTPHSPELAPFDLAAFVAQFPLFARAPNGIANLRALILQLAVQGKLVPQDPNDEPASASLEKIAAEREQLIKTGKIKKEKPLPMIADDEKLFELPEKWVWVRLASILSISSGKNLTSSQMNPKGEIPVFGGNGITGYHDQSNIFKPTLVIGRVGFYCGSIHITPDKAWITDNAFITYFSEENIDLVFLSWLLKSKNLNENDSATAQPVISGRKVYPIVVALPPLEEQQRIVAKVDELMALCDQLEAQQDDQARNLLEANTAAVQAVTKTPIPSPSPARGEGSEDAQENAELLSPHPLAGGGLGRGGNAWQRIATHFNTLYGTNLPLPSEMRRGKLKDRTVALENIAKLRQLIRELGLKGKLTDSDATHWQWHSFASLGDNRLGKMLDQAKNSGTAVKYLRNTNVQWYRFELDDLLEMKVEEHELPKITLLPGDLVICEGGEAGRAAIWNGEPIVIQKALHRFRCYDELFNQYALLCLRTDVESGRLAEYYTGATIKHFTGKALKDYTILLPPLEEQHRIVAQVDELMALCDTLETLLTEQRQVAADFSAAAVLAVTA